MNRYFTKLMVGVMLGSLAMGAAAYADQNDAARSPRRVVELPVVSGWYAGHRVLYVQTEASDAGVAAQQQVNYVPGLANALDAPSPAVDDIYVVTNFVQGNILPSAPIPAGPGNTNANYSPLWQVSTVTWANPKVARTLHSEAEVLAAKAASWVTLKKTRIVVNCSVMHSVEGGTFPNAKFETQGDDR